MQYNDDGIVKLQSGVPPTLVIEKNISELLFFDTKNEFEQQQHYRIQCIWKPQIFTQQKHTLHL